jgi:hypothetical protein
LLTERDGALGYSGSNLLGKAWAQKKGVDYWISLPSLYEIFAGIMIEGRYLIEKSTCTFYNKELLNEALYNFYKTWLDIPNFVTDVKIYAPLTNKILHDPNHFITKLMLEMYSSESYLYKTLNYAIRVGDLSKIDSLGPFAHAMNQIVEQAISAKDQELDASLFYDLNLFRGTNLTLTQIK